MNKQHTSTTFSDHNKSVESYHGQAYGWISATWDYQWWVNTKERNSRHASKGAVPLERQDQEIFPWYIAWEVGSRTCTRRFWAQEAWIDVDQCSLNYNKQQLCHHIPWFVATGKFGAYSANSEDDAEEEEVCSSYLDNEVYQVYYNPLLPSLNLKELDVRSLEF